MILIGYKIKELRKKYKYTQTELANRVGVTKSTIAAYENNSRMPSYDVLIKLADLFRVSIDSILLNRTEYIIDVSGLSPDQIHLVQEIVVHFRKSELLDQAYDSGSINSKRFKKYQLMLKQKPDAEDRPL